MRAGERLRELRACLPILTVAIAARALAYAVMTAMALWNERRPAPVLPDVVISAVPFVPWISRVNYLAWLFVYVPLALAFLWLEPVRWSRYMITGASLSLARGVCIVLTGLGPPDPLHAGRGTAGLPFVDTYLDLLSPLGVFSRGSAHAYLTKDLFFSGHTSTTFLLVLYLWPHRRLRWMALGAHALVVSTVLLAHLHYSIDVAGAWAFTFAFYAAREWGPAKGPLPAASNVAKIAAGERG